MFALILGGVFALAILVSTIASCFGIEIFSGDCFGKAGEKAVEASLEGDDDEGEGGFGGGIVGNAMQVFV
jgi:hypothetical protein